jgi:hypothetical protein
MTFEQKCNDYFLVLRDSGVIIDAQLFGVDENFRTANGAARFIDADSVVNEKKIYLYEINGEINWSYYTPLNINE